VERLPQSWHTVIIMSNTFAGGVHVVAASNDRMIEYWAVATSREAAVSTVQQLLPPGWTATLTDSRLTPDQVAGLNLRAGGARQLKYAPSVCPDRSRCCFNALSWHWLRAHVLVMGRHDQARRRFAACVADLSLLHRAQC
jgi:hypothetical protein